MRQWYRFETGNEKRKDALRTFLRRNGYRFECHQDDIRRCDWWRIDILTMDQKQAQDINAWLQTH